MKRGDYIRALEKAIRAKCLDCCGGMRKVAEVCNMRGCPLWEFRRVNAAGGQPGDGGARREDAPMAGQMGIQEIMEGIGI